MVPLSSMSAISLSTTALFVSGKRYGRCPIQTWSPTYASRHEQPYPDHPLKGNLSYYRHAALNAHPFLLFFTSCSISTFFSFFIPNLLPIPYETYPRGKHTGKTTHLQTDGFDRPLQVPSWSSRSRPSPRSVPLSVIRYPLSDIRQSHSSLSSMDVSSTGCHTVVSAGYPDPVDRRSDPPSPSPLVGPTMFSDGSPSFSESNHR